ENFFSISVSIEALRYGNLFDNNLISGEDNIYITIFDGGVSKARWQVARAEADLQKARAERLLLDIKSTNLEVTKKLNQLFDAWTVTEVESKAALLAVKRATGKFSHGHEDIFDYLDIMESANQIIIKNEDLRYQ